MTEILLYLLEQYIYYNHFYPNKAVMAYWAKAQVQYLIGLWFNSPHGHFILGDLD